jgi:hypothetical protein
MISLTFTVDYPGLTPQAKQRIGKMLERRLKDQIARVTSTMTIAGEELASDVAVTPFMMPDKLDVNSIVIVS